MCYSSVNDVKCIWELVSGDFARTGLSHNLWGVRQKRSTLMKMNFQRADLFVLV